MYYVFCTPVYSNVIVLKQALESHQNQCFTIAKRQWTQVFTRKHFLCTILYNITKLRQHKFEKAQVPLSSSCFPPVKVSHLLKESMILDEERSAGSDRHRVELVRNWGAMPGGQGGNVLKYVSKLLKMLYR